MSAVWEATRLHFDFSITFPKVIVATDALLVYLGLDPGRSCRVERRAGSGGVYRLKDTS